MKVRDVLKLLKSGGWYLVATEGSHRQYKRPRKSGRVTEFHIRGLREDGLPIPDPSSRVDYVENAA